MQPTPNGRLHIGHGGGPYLRADVIARALRRDGEHVEIISGSDAYENWVLADGLATGRTPEQTCAVYHAGIKSDLDRLGVELNLWVDPLSAEHNSGYVHVQERLLSTLSDSGRAELFTERVPLGVESGRPLMGVWIAGECPNCGAAAGGNSCTACSDSFSPDLLRNPRSRLTNEQITWVDRPNWFAPAPRAVLEALAATGLPGQFQVPVQTFLDRKGARIRLSLPGEWGVPSSLAPTDSVLSNTYYGYSVYCGQLYSDLRSGVGNALDRDSGVTVVGLFGSDNSIAGLVAPQVLAVGTAFKAFDHTVINHMLHFEGRKCSTSQQHGIWIEDVIDKTNVSSDELRYCLTQIPLDRNVSDIDTGRIVTTVNRLRVWRTATLGPVLEALKPGASTPTAPVELRAALERQQQYLRPPVVDLVDATDVLTDWMFKRDPQHCETEAVAEWLLGVALLGAPILPILAGQLWTELGLPGVPSRSVLNHAVQLSRTSAGLDLRMHTPLNAEDIAGIAR
ncbi:class I tRNA ligase family protein [Nocardia ninae]|nr:class I tRNA ligase family protein [Nocardia ninae]